MDEQSREFLAATGGDQWTSANQATQDARAAFEAVTRPVVEWLCANRHPHVTVVITPTGAELLEGTTAYTTTEYLRD